MSLLSDILLAAGAFAAAIYCLVLSRRLKALTGLDSGMGKAIAVLSAQVDDLNRTLRAAQDSARGMSGRLGSQTERAETAARRLELLIASLHDLPDPAEAAPQVPRRPGRGERAGIDQDRTDSDAEPGAARSRVLRRRAAEPAL